MLYYHKNKQLILYTKALLIFPVGVWNLVFIEDAHHIGQLVAIVQYRSSSFFFSLPIIAIKESYFSAKI